MTNYKERGFPLRDRPSVGCVTPLLPSWLDSLLIILGVGLGLMLKIFLIHIFYIFTVYVDTSCFVNISVSEGC